MAKVGLTDRKNRKFKKEADAALDTALTILEKLPKHDEDIFPLSVETDANAGVYPLQMFQQLFEKLGGADAVPKIVARIICNILDPMEIAIKGVLLSNLQSIIQDCSLNLWISDDLIKNGIIFDIRHIDMFDTLEFSPLGAEGSYYYTDCEDINTIDGLIEASDFNALLYYVKQRNSNRVVWADPKKIKRTGTYYERKKEREDNAILTLDFVERPTSLKDNLGAPHEHYDNNEVPYNNCLQLFIGNAMLDTIPQPENRYKGKTIMSFNTDYITSIKLFDKKTVIAQIMANMSGVYLGGNVSFKAQLLNEEIENLITQVIHNDNIAVSDCFFTFSNEEYDALLQRAEMKHFQGQPFGGVFENEERNIANEELINMINNFPSDATLEEVTTFIEGAQYQIQSKKYGDGLTFKGSINFDKKAMLESFLDSLAKIIIRSVLTPKVYLLIMTNRALMGDIEDFRIEEFLKRCKNLLMNIITQINDIILEALMEILTENLRPLASQLLEKIGLEQMRYWHELLIKMIDCVKRKRGLDDFDIANVQYADIYNNDNVVTDVEC